MLHILDQALGKELGELGIEDVGLLLTKKVDIGCLVQEFSELLLVMVDGHRIVVVVGDAALAYRSPISLLDIFLVKNCGT